MNDATHPAVPTALIWVAVGIAIVARFGMRELRERRVRLDRLYVVPAIVGAIAILLAWAAAVAAPQHIAVLALCSLPALGVGCAIGLAVARFTTVRVTGEAGIVFLRGSYATLGIWIVALALRASARFIVGSGDLGATAVANAVLLVLLAAALATVRYRVSIEARSARARGIATELPAM